METSMLLEDYFAKHYLPHKPDTNTQTKKLYRNSFRKFGEFLGHVPTLDDLTDANVGGLMASVATCQPDRNEATRANGAAGNRTGKRANVVDG